MSGILQPQVIRQVGSKLTGKVTHLGSQLSRLFPDKTGFPLQVLIKYNHTFPHHQSVFCSAETKDVNPTVYSQFFERKMKGGTGIGNPCSVHVYIHTVQMGKVSQTFQFFGCINRSEFGALGDVKRTGLRMMLVAETVQIRLHQFGSQLTVGCGNRPNLTTCHFHGRAALVYINMGSFRTED